VSVAIIMGEDARKDIELANLSSSEKISFEDLLREKELQVSQKVLDFIKRRINIINWLPKYSKTQAIGDFIAGVTIGLTMIPQSLAYANLANVPAVYGLYSAFVGSVIYTIIGTVREVSIGPTSLMSIMTVAYTYEKPIEYVFIMTFVCGCVEMLMGIFRLGA
jgi:sodium-independent sulfate anion transporter 11